MTHHDHPWRRTHDCGSLSVKDIGQIVTLAGWVDTRRDHGGLIFIDLRDRSGITQVVFNPETNTQAHQEAHQLRNEFVLTIQGLVRGRPEGMANPNLKTGEIEVLVQEYRLLNTSKTPPFSLRTRPRFPRPSACATAIWTCGGRPCKRISFSVTGLLNSCANS